MICTRTTPGIYLSDLISAPSPVVSSDYCESNKKLLHVHQRRIDYWPGQWKKKCYSEEHRDYLIGIFVDDRINWSFEIITTLRWSSESDAHMRHYNFSERINWNWMEISRNPKQTIKILKWLWIERIMEKIKFPMSNIIWINGHKAMHHPSRF